MEASTSENLYEDLIGKKSNDLIDRIPLKKNKIVIKNALDFSVKMHEGQKRKSGLPYVSH